MKTIKYIILLTVIISAGFSCSEDWLDIEQKGAILQEDYFSTDDECLSSLAAVYDMIQVTNEQDWSSLFHMKLILSDESNAGGENEGDQPEYHEMDDYAFTPSNTKIYDVWENLYYAVYRANVVITKVVDSTAARKIIIAEAKALRAYLYFELVNLYGSVPLVTTIPETSEDYYVAKSTEADIWAQIETDLEEAIPDLPLRSETEEGSEWRIAKGFAQAMLGKALIFEEKYSDALPYLTAVIESGEYALVDDFDRVLRYENEYGSESLFEIGYVTTEGHNWSNFDYWDEARLQEINLHWILDGPRDGFFTPGDSLEMFAGWGAAPAKENSYDFFNDDDPRRAYTVLSEAELAEIGASLRDDSDELQHEGEGYLRMKYTTWNDETSGTDGNGDEPGLNIGTNIRVMRYAEVYLLAAEAYLGNGDPANAATMINYVRARPSVNYTPLTSATWEDLKYERATELCYEGHRFYDLVRWGDAEEVLGDLGFESKYSHFPIPQSELDANPSLVQNDPWP